MSEYRNKFFKDSRLLYVELRYTTNSANHYKPHRHDTLSIGAIEDGLADFVTTDQKAILEPGQLIAINPERLHSCNPIEGEARSYYMLYLDKEWCMKLQQSIYPDAPSYLPISQTLIKDIELYRLYLHTAQILLDTETLFLEKEEYLERLMIEIFGNYCDTNIPTTYDSPQDSQLVPEAKHFLQEHISSNPTLEEIASHIGTSKFGLIRQFREATGMTPHAYLLNLRMEKAKELLHTDMPIAEIALDVGLNDQSHLNRLFKQYAACTPNEYRRGMVGL